MGSNTHAAQGGLSRDRSFIFVDLIFSALYRKTIAELGSFSREREANMQDLSQKINDSTFEVPTLIIEPFFKGGQSWVFVQWFAECSPIASVKNKAGDTLIETFQHTQFRFPVLVSRHDECWMGRPDLFKVVLLGQVQDLPNGMIIPRLGENDDWLLWVVSSHYGIETRNGRGPASFAVPLKIMFGHHICGIITPKKYYDSTVIDREKETFMRQGRQWSSCALRLNG